MRGPYAGADGRHSLHLEEPDTPDQATEDGVDGDGPQHLEDDSPSEEPFKQNRFVIRHAARMEDVTWLAAAERPWDPPLTDEGKAQAWQAGLELRREEWNISMVLCSPFLRCVQTAAEVVRALLTEDVSQSSRRLDDGKSDPPAVKACGRRFFFCMLPFVMLLHPHTFVPPFPASSGLP